MRNRPTDRDGREGWVRRLPAVIFLVAVLAVPTRFTLRVVMGASMVPVLLPGDVCVVERSSEGVGEGDVVLLERKGWRGGVLHRVIAVDEGAAVTKGDANARADRDRIALDEVRGKVAFVIPFGRLTHFLGSTANGKLRSQHR